MWFLKFKYSPTLKILCQTAIIVFNYIDEITPKKDNTNSCDISENGVSKKLIEDRSSVKPENDLRKTLTSPYAVSNNVVIDKREEEGGSSVTQTKNLSHLDKQMNGNSNIGLPPNGYILPGKMKLGNALNIPAINSVYLASIAQNVR